MKKLVIAVVVALAAAVPLVSRLLRTPEPPKPEGTAAEYLAAWGRSDWAAMSRLVEAAPQTFAAVHEQMLEDLEVASSAFAPGRIVVDLEEPERAEAPFTATLRLKGLGEWAYEGTLRLALRQGRWRVLWTESAVHPELRADRRFQRTRAWAERAPILARDGTPLAASGEVVEIGIEPRRIKDREQLVQAFETEVGIDPARVNAILDRPGVRPDWFLPVLEVSTPRYEELRRTLIPVPGVVLRKKAGRIGVAPGFARHVVGTIGEATAERLEELGEPYLPGDAAGTIGLERELESRLAGAPSGEVRLVDGQGKALSVLHQFPGAAPQPVTTTLDVEVQAAAEKALEGVPQPAAVVAVDAATGELRAVVSRPVEGFNRALSGKYPPGSTFKIVTAAAVLASGRQPADTVSCPGEVAVGGKRFRNVEGLALGDIPLSEAFARSCNTAFVQLAGALDDQKITAAAESFGFGAGYSLPLTVFGGSFPPPRDRTERAAAGIGQARVEVSPLHMATVAAAVASGTWRAPKLIATDQEAVPPRPLDPGVAGTLRSLMQLVVTDGTGTAAAVPGPPVAGKTGSAEFGRGTPPPTHAWFVGFRGQLAFGVFVEGGGFGGRVAAPIAAAFLAAL